MTSPGGRKKLNILSLGSATEESGCGAQAYMTRLGLWGPGSAFPNFNAFLDSMKKRGVSFLEVGFQQTSTHSSQITGFSISLRASLFVINAGTGNGHRPRAYSYTQKLCLFGSVVAVTVVQESPY
jgi:hypothetical protein